MPQADRLRWLLAQDDETRAAALSLLNKGERDELRWHWDLWARPEQLAPPGDWQVWLICAGRGFGKTRAGAEWVRFIARREPDSRIALISASLAEVRAVMVEGESGILACSPPHRRPVFEPSLRRLTWPNGAQAFLYSAAEPESLRGPQHSHAWCDEIAKWDASSGRPEKTWDNLMLGLRMGETSRVLATTTPRVVPLLQRLLAEHEADKDGVVLTKGRTYDNAANLPERFIRDIRRNFGASALGRQELDGEIITEVEGALWSRAMLEGCRTNISRTELTRIVVAVDPPITAHGDECGIIVAGLTQAGIGVVLADCTVAKPSPERWASPQPMTL